MVTIREVSTRRGLSDFIHYPFSLYKDSPHWIPPLLSEEWSILRSKKNPAFEYCEARLFLAERNGTILGRVAAIRNDKANDRFDQRHLRFGWIDFIDDHEVSSALIHAVEKWAADQGLQAVHGPLGFTDMDKEGMLIEGFDELGTFPMIYNYEYYPTHMERLGYTKDVDWLEYEIQVPEELNEKFDRLKSVVFRKYGLHLVQAKRPRDLRVYARRVLQVLNESYVDLYGFVPLSDGEIELYIDQYFSFVQPDFTKVVVDEHDDVVGFEIAMPRLSRALQRSGGRLFPFGFIPFLRALAAPKEVMFYLIGVRPDFQARGVNAILMSEFYRSLIKRGIRTVSTCGELEDNKEVNMLMNSFPHRQHKRRRAYIKQIDDHTNI